MQNRLESMAVFVAIVDEDDAEKFARRVKKKFGGDALQINETAWFVAAEGTTNDVTHDLGFNSEVELGGFLGRLGSYDGWSDQTVWDWLKAKLEKK